MLLLVLSSLLVLAAAAFLATRARLGSRAEFLLACTVLWNFLVLVPIHFLGLVHRLTAGWLAVSVFVECAACIAVSFVRVPWREHLTQTRESLRGALLLPFSAVRETWNARSFALIGVIACGGIIAYTIWLSYLLPSDSWDGLWYHELMIGYAMQNHGYASIALPTNVPFPASMIQQANGFPRNCDMTNLWFVIFSGRDLVEVVNSFALCPLMLGTFCLARRVCKENAAALGWSAAIATIPAVSMQLRSTYIDVHVAALYLAALHLCTRPGMRLRDAWLGSISLALLIGAKSMTLASVPVLWLALAVLATRHNWSRKARLSGTLVGGSLVVVAMASVCYVRNWVLFKNPLWPMSYEKKSLGIDFHGLASIDAIIKQQGEFTLAQTYASITAFHPPGGDYADTGAWAYGDGVAFVVVPLGLVGLAVLLVAIVRRLVDRLGKAPPRPDGDTVWNLALVSLVLLLIAAGAPKLWYPRYNVHLAAGLMFLTAWLMRRPRFSDAVSAVVLASNLLFLYRAKPGWGVELKDSLVYAARTAEERDVYSPSPWSITPEVARARDHELVAGTKVAFAADVVFVFVAQLWNEHYTNQLFFVPPASTAEFLAGADRIRAAWVVVGESSSIARDLKQRSGEWQQIGKVSRGYPSLAFRRVHR